MRFKSEEQRQAVMASLRGQRRRGGRSGAVWARRASGGLIVKTPWSVREARTESLRAAGASEAKRALGLWESQRRREATARKKARSVLLKTLAAGAGLAALGGGVALARSPRLQLALGKRMMRVRRPLGIGAVRRGAKGLGNAWEGLRRDVAYGVGERAAAVVRRGERWLLDDDIAEPFTTAYSQGAAHKVVVIRPSSAPWMVLRRRAGKIVGVRREPPAGFAGSIFAKVESGHLTPEQGMAQLEHGGALVAALERPAARKANVRKVIKEARVKIVGKAALPPGWKPGQPLPGRSVVTPISTPVEVQRVARPPLPKYRGAERSQQRMLQDYLAEEAAASGYGGERIRRAVDKLEIRSKRRLQKGLPHPFDLLRKRFWRLPIDPRTKKPRQVRRIWAMDIDPEWVQKMTPAGRARMKQRDAAWIARKMGYAKVRGLEP